MEERGGELTFWAFINPCCMETFERTVNLSLFLSWQSSVPACFWLSCHWSNFDCKLTIIFECQWLECIMLFLVTRFTGKLGSQEVLYFTPPWSLFSRNEVKNVCRSCDIYHTAHSAAHSSVVPGQGWWFSDNLQKYFTNYFISSFDCSSSSVCLATTHQQCD